MEKDGFLNLSGHHLQVFLAIFDTDSVTKAAELLGCNQSTISYSLDKLRTCLEDPLFVKSGRNIVASERAIVLAPMIRSQLAGLENLSNAGKFSPDNETIPLTIATNTIEFLPQCETIFNMVAEQAPQMAVKFMDLGPRENIGHYLESAKADLILASHLVQCPTELNTKSVLKDRRVCFYDPEYGKPVLSLDKYCEARHAILDFGGNIKSAIDVFFGRAKPKPQDSVIRTECTDPGSTC